jgi:opacity protein-like surface antigen
MRTPILVFATTLIPATALADDPPLHVDPSVEDCEVRFAPELTQSAYHRFVREFGSASAFKQMGAPEVIGKKGVAFGIEYMAFEVDEHAAAWNDTFTHPDAGHELGSDRRFPKLKVRVGVGGNTDVGAYYTMNPESNYGWIGVDAKHALLRQSPEMPVTLAVRAAYTKTLFVDDMDMHSLSADVSVGRTLRYHLQPYAGVGIDNVLARETSPMVELDTEYTSVGHAFGGLQVALSHFLIGAEVHYATIPSAHAQLAWVF